MPSAQGVRVSTAPSPPKDILQALRRHPWRVALAILALALVMLVLLWDWNWFKGPVERIVQARTGLLRCYLSRVENGHTVPSLETLQKIARALDLQLAEFFAEEVVSKEMSCPSRPLPSDAYSSPSRDAVWVTRS